VIQEMVSETLRPTCRCISSSSYRPAHPAFIFGLTLQRLRQLGDVGCDAPDGRISELRDEIDELRDLVSRLREHAEESDACIESWKETFDMVQTESGGWTWSPFWEEHNQLIQDYNDLVRYWNKYLPRINGEPRNVGRPLAASEAQVAHVRKLRKAGASLREIADDTSLGFRTVRTIVEQANGTDRTTKKHRGRLDISGAVVRWKRQKRTGQYLPKRAQTIVEKGEALIREAKGLGKV
jgi:hypothetical protein